MIILHGVDLGIAMALQTDLLCTFVYVANWLLDKDTGTDSRRAWKNSMASEAAMRCNTFPSIQLTWFEALAFSQRRGR